MLRAALLACRPSRHLQRLGPLEILNRRAPLRRCQVRQSAGAASVRSSRIAKGDNPPCRYRYSNTPYPAGDGATTCYRYCESRRWIDRLDLLPPHFVPPPMCTGIGGGCEGKTPCYRYPPSPRPSLALGAT